MTYYKSGLNWKLCFNIALLYYFKVSLEITPLDIDILCPVMPSAFPKLCVCFYKKAAEKHRYVIWPIHITKLIFLNYISVLISPTKFHREDRGTSLIVKSKGPWHYPGSLQRMQKWKSLLIWNLDTESHKTALAWVFLTPGG